MPLIRNKSDKAATSAAPVSLAAGLASASTEARWAAARSVAAEPEHIPALAEALAKEHEPRVREAIFTALSRIATPESAGSVIPYIRSDDAELRTGALDSLRAMPAATRAQLAALLLDPDSDVRLLACDLAREAASTEIVRLLCKLIEEDAQPNVCAAAIEVLAEIGNVDAVEALARCAVRFPDDPFLVFAIRAASERLSQS
jgi:HEAT repeat protein